MSQLLLTIFLGPAGRFHGFEYAVQVHTVASTNAAVVAAITAHAYVPWLSVSLWTLPFYDLN